MFLANLRVAQQYVSFFSHFLSNHSLCGGFPVPSGKSAFWRSTLEEWGIYEILFQCYTPPSQLHFITIDGWAHTGKRTLCLNFLIESAVFFLKSNFQLREMKNSSVSYSDSFQLPGLCLRSPKIYLFSCWKKCDTKLISHIYTHSSILLGIQSTLKKNIGTFWTCGSLALQNIKLTPLPLALRKNFPVADNKKEIWREWVGETWLHWRMQCSHLIW